MTKPTITIHDVETNEIIEREMTDAEFKQYKEDILACEKEALENEKKAMQKAALLEKLGITDDEAKLLLS